MHVAPLPRESRSPLQFALVALPAVALAGYFVLPGWLSAGCVLLELACIAVLLRPSLRGRVAALLQVPDVRWMLAAFAAPIAALATVEAAHGEFAPHYFESPARLLFGAAVMLACAALRIDFSRVASVAVPAAIFACAAWVLAPGHHAYFWAGRAATIFMDPITLAMHAIIAGFVCAFLVEPNERRAFGLNLALVLAFGLSLAVALLTRSRTPWTFVPFVAAMLAGWHAPRSRLSAPGVAVFIALLVVLAYLLVPTIHARVDESVHDIQQYFGGGTRDTPVGIRLSLFQTNVVLFLHKPVLGWGFVEQPDLLAFPPIRALYTPMFEHYWVTAGGHNEYLQSMMRMGVAGLASRMLLMVAPLVVFARAVRHGDGARRRNGFLGLVVVIGYLFSSLTMEVFNLSYTSSFYALLVGLFAAGAVPNPLRSGPGGPAPR